MKRKQLPITVLFDIVDTLVDAALMKAINFALSQKE